MKNLANETKEQLIYEIKKLRKKNLEVAFLESEQRFRDLVNLLPQIVFETDLLGNLIFSNEKALQQFGYSREEFNKGINVLNTLTPEDAIIAKKNIQRIFQGKEVNHPEYTARRKDGSTFPVMIYANAVFKDKKPFGLRGIIIDITNQKEAEAALQKSEEKYRLLATNTLDVIWVTDLDFNTTFISNSIFNLMGYTPEEVLKTKPSVFISPKHMATLREKANELIELFNKGEKQQYQFEIQQIRKDGTTVDVELTTNLLLDKNNQVIGFQGRTVDITKHLQSEKIQRLLETAIEHTAEVVVITDTSGIIQYANPAFEKISGYQRAEAIGQNPNMLSSGKHNKKFYKELWDTIKSGKTWHGEFINRRKDGVEYFEKATISPVKNASGKIINFIATKENITEHKKAEEALQNSELKFRLLADHTYDWEYWIDTNGNYIYISPSCERITGYKPDEFLANKNILFEIVKPEYANKVIQHYSDENNKDAPVYKMEFPIIARNGEERWIDHNCSPVFDSEGNFLGRRGNNRDITDRKRTEEDLRNSEQRFRRIIEQASDALFIQDFEGNIVEVNNKTCESLGYSREELLKLSTADIDESYNNIKFRKKLMGKLQKGETVAIESVLKRKNGTTFPAEINLGIIELKNRNVVLGFARDITERKQTEEELKKHRIHLEEMVKERTKELEEKNEELERFNQLFVGREFRIKELRDKVQILEKQKGRNDSEE